MSSRLRQRVEQKLATTMKRFKVNEFQRCVILHFPEINWDSFKQYIVRNKLRLSRKNAVMYLTKRIKELNLTEESLLLRLLVLDLTAVSRHSSSKIWHAYKMKEPLDEGIIIENEEIIKNRLSEYLEKKGIACKFEITNYDNATFLGFRENKLKLAPMVYFALYIGRNYFFCSTDRAADFLIKAVLNTMNFTKKHVLRLQGRSLNSLLTILDCKESQTVHGENVPEEMDTQPIENERGLDATLHRQRSEFVKKCMGDIPVKVENINLRAEKFVFENPFSNAEGFEIDVNWTIHGKNAIESLPILAKKGILVTPLPEYIKKFMIIGQTDMKIR